MKTENDKQQTNKMERWLSTFWYDEMYAVHSDQPATMDVERIKMGHKTKEWNTSSNSLASIKLSISNHHKTIIPATTETKRQRTEKK